MQSRTSTDAGRVPERRLEPGGHQPPDPRPYCAVPCRGEDRLPSGLCDFRYACASPPPATDTRPLENASSPWAHAFPRASPDAAANIADMPKARTSTPGGVTAAPRLALSGRAANSPPAAVYSAAAKAAGERTPASGVLSRAFRCRYASPRRLAKSHPRATPRTTEPGQATYCQAPSTRFEPVARTVSKKSVAANRIAGALWPDSLAARKAPAIPPSAHGNAVASMIQVLGLR